MASAPQELQRALRDGEFAFYYQPKVSFLTGEVTGAEALLRWHKPDGRVAPSGEFIRDAERSGIIRAITEQMFPRLVEDFQAIRSHDEAVHVSLNVFARDLDAPRLLALIHDAIARGSMDGEHLDLEVTESAVVADSESVLETLRGLVASGIRLSMDDFGTGFSSLETLNRLPFTAIKMDQSFVLTMLRSPKSATLVKSNIAMAQMLGMSAVVEGIETEAIYRTLLHAGCDEGQGYWISRPLPLADYLELLRSGRRWAASSVGLLRMAQLSHLWQHKMLVDLVCSVVQDGGAGAEAVAIGHDYASCALANWYAGPGQAYAGADSFEALAEPHRRMHELGNGIRAAVRRNHARAELTALLGELSESCKQVLSCLEDLELHALCAELD